MRPNVFAKAGDSNLGSYGSLYGLGCREPDWHGYESLEPTMRRYREVLLPAGDGPPLHIEDPPDRAPWNSFGRSSAATHSGIVGPQVLRPSSQFNGLDGWYPDPDCPPDESMISFEIGTTRPRFVFIMFGTNGSSYGFTARETAAQTGDIVDEVRRLGPVPVVCTIPPQLDHGHLQGRWDFARSASEEIALVAEAKGAPLFDQWKALASDRLLNHGMIEFDGGHFDGFHLQTKGGFRAPDHLQQSVDFSPEALRYGNNLRNLLMLQVLDALDGSLA